MRQMSTQLNTQQFLCLCDVLCAKKETITFSELRLWSQFVLTKPIRELYAAGRELFLAFKRASQSEEGQVFQRGFCRFVVTDTPGDVDATADRMSTSIMPGAKQAWLKLAETIRIDALEKIETEEITKFVTQSERDASLCQFGEIVEILGKNSRALANNPEGCQLIRNFVAQFDGH